MTPDGDLRPVALARGWRILDDSTGGLSDGGRGAAPGLAALGLVAAFLALTVAGPLIGVAGSAAGGRIPALPGSPHRRPGRRPSSDRPAAPPRLARAAQ